MKKVKSPQQIPATKRGDTYRLNVEKPKSKKKPKK